MKKRGIVIIWPGRTCSSSNSDGGRTGDITGHWSWACFRLSSGMKVLLTGATAVLPPFLLAAGCFLGGIFEAFYRPRESLKVVNLAV